MLYTQVSKIKILIKITYFFTEENSLKTEPSNGTENYLLFIQIKPLENQEKHERIHKDLIVSQNVFI